MDKLPADQQATIAKSSCDRLRQTLLSAGEEATVSTMDRGALKEAAAKQKLQGPVEPSSLERDHNFDLNSAVSSSYIGT